MGDPKDFVEGFGKAILNGGNGFDILSLYSYNIDEFNISLGAINKNQVTLDRDDISMNATNFEQLNEGEWNFKLHL